VVVTEGDTANPAGQFGATLGEACDSDTPCRQGLLCQDDVCAATGDRTEGGTCIITPECGEGLVCGALGLCTPEGGAEQGQPCAVTEDCKRGLYCDYIGLLGLCAQGGDADAFQPCDSTLECQPGLLCDTLGGTCAHPATFVAQLLAQRVCPPDEGPARAYFEVPAKGVPLPEFYRLPFPNDARVFDGRIDLTGHPTLAQSPLGFDPVAPFVKAIEATSKGYSTAANALLRLSEEIDASSIVTGRDKEGEAPLDTIALIDITPGSPDYGVRLPIAWSTLTGKGSAGRYICEDWISVRPLWVRPLRPGNTYAAVLLKGLAAKSGQDYARDADFEVVMSGAAPSDSRLNHAWKAYAPLREFAADTSPKLPISADRLLSAAVFTTASASEPIESIRAWLETQGPPAVTQLVRCGAGVVSPCDDGLTGADHQRGCFEETANFIELHGRMTVPILQQGQAPYLEAIDGGEVQFTQGGDPKPNGTADICFALSIPKLGAMPETGWPTALYAHGTNGSFRTPMANGVASDLANLEESGQAVRFAVLSIEQVQHGDRRGGSDLSPELLFFNVANPPAALGNVLQAVADAFSQEQLAAAFDLDAALSPTNERIALDPNALYFVGHSQGATTGIPYLAHSRRVRAAVLSGAGGGLSLSLLHKSSPVNIAAGLGVALGDVTPGGASRVNDHHPVLGLLQHYFHVADPLSHAFSVVREPPEGAMPKHVLHIWGTADTFSPDPTIKALAGAMRLTQAEPAEDPVPGAPIVTPPLRETTGTATAVVTDWPPDGYDGHFVVTNNADARRQVRGFLFSAVTDPDRIPTVPK
jgi:pimeloyl-ACP methyl ester carboxylesterase